MNSFARLGDYFERRAQLKAYLAATGGNFESKISEEEKRFLQERREAAKKSRLAKTEAEAADVAWAELKLISDRYRPELLFDDDEFFGFKANWSTLDFFKGRKSFLATWRDSEGELASEVIDTACRLYGLDQRMIILSLQREQSAVAKTKPMSARKMKRILGFGCYDGVDENARGRDLERFYGFRKQITNAARRYIELANSWVKGGEIRVNFRKASVTPLNAPTWALYRYTPHTHAGKVSYLIGRSFFGF